MEVRSPSSTQSLIPTKLPVNAHIMSQPSPFSYSITNPSKTYSYPQQPGNPPLNSGGIATSSPFHQKSAQSYTNTSSHPSPPSFATEIAAAPHPNNATTTLPLPIPSSHIHAPTSTPPSTSLYCLYPAIHTLRPFTCTTPSTRSTYAAPGDYSTS